MSEQVYECVYLILCICVCVYDMCVFVLYIYSWLDGVVMTVHSLTVIVTIKTPTAIYKNTTTAITTTSRMLLCILK